tara:strand:- start:7917 stop:8435 length:519 start_codon:yes stop_codon:yes gene_type:complete
MPSLSNKVHESFARLSAIGTSRLDAYLSAMAWNEKKLSTSYQVNAKNAAVLAKDPTILARTEEFKHEMAVKAEVEFAIDLKKAIKLLVDTLNSRPEDASMDNPLCEITYVGRNGEPRAIFPSKAKYMEILAKVMGWNSETINLKGDVHIEFTVHDRVDYGTKKLAHATAIDI